MLRRLENGGTINFPHSGKLRSLPKQIRKIFSKIAHEDFPSLSPHQILVRFLLRNNLIGYGGIVHIDWVNLRGEVSFLLETSRTYDHQNYARELNIFFLCLRNWPLNSLNFRNLPQNPMQIALFT